jgi:uncharacterized membrane protein SpoIIM required for sporulation
MEKNHRPIRFRTDEEIKETLSKPWLAFFGLSYLIGGIIIGTCEGYLLVSVLYGLNGYGYPCYSTGICGVRIGLAVLFWATGISLMALIFSKKRSKTTLSALLTLLTLVLGVASLIGAIKLSQKDFQNSGLESLRYLTRTG